jgi:inner membrane protein
MRAYSHVLLGVSGWLGFCKLGQIPPEILATAAAAFGSLLPDIDHPQSFLGRRLWFIALPLAALIGHRGLTHSLMAASVGAWLLSVGLEADRAMVQGLAFGYLSHLAGDWLTPAGVPLLWPWRRRFASPLHFRSGGAVEQVLNLFLLGWLLSGGWL